MQGGAPRRLALFQEGGSPAAPWGRSWTPPCQRERVGVGRGALLAGGNEPQPRGPVCPRSGLASCCSLLSLPRVCVCVKLPVGNRVPLSLVTLPHSVLRRVRHLRVRKQQQVGGGGGDLCRLRLRSRPEEEHFQGQGVYAAGPAPAQGVQIRLPGGPGAPGPGLLHVGGPC